MRCSKHKPRRSKVRMKSIGLFAFVWMLFQVTAATSLWAQNCIGLTKVHENLAGQSLNSVAYHNGEYLAVGDDGLVLMSSNGMDWMVLDPGTTHDLVDVVWAGDRFAIITFSGVADSTILSWTSGGGFQFHNDLIQFAHGQALGWDGTKLIMAYYDGLTDSGRFRTTTDFVVSATNDMEMSTHCGEVSDIDVVNGVILMGWRCMLDGFSQPGAFVYSFDGFNFDSEATGPPSSFGAGAIATNGTIAFGSAFSPIGPVNHFTHTPEIGVEAFTVYDDSPEIFRNTIRDADWVQDTFIGVGPAGLFGHSADGLNWSEITSPNQGTMARVIPTVDGGFVAVGEMETIVLGTPNPFPGIYTAWPETISCLDLIMTLESCPAAP